MGFTAWIARPEHVSHVMRKHALIFVVFIPEEGLAVYSAAYTDYILYTVPTKWSGAHRLLYPKVGLMLHRLLQHTRPRYSIDLIISQMTGPSLIIILSQLSILPCLATSSEQCSRCHTKRRVGMAPPAKPSFGMIMTKIL